MFFKIRNTWSFHDFVLQRVVTKCTKNYNASAQALSCSLNLLSSDVPFTVVVYLKLPNVHDLTKVS